MFIKSVADDSLPYLVKSVNLAWSLFASSHHYLQA